MRILRLFSKDKRGVTVIEFALIAPVMLFMVFATLELSYYNYMRAHVEAKIHNVGRLAMTGNMYNSTDVDRRTYLNRLIKEEVNKAVFSGVTPVITTDVFLTSDNFKSGTALSKSGIGQSFGDANQILRVRVNVTYKFFTPLLGMLENKIDSFKFVTTVFIQNEAY